MTQSLLVVVVRLIGFSLLMFVSLTSFAYAATLQTSPSTGVHALNSTFSVRVTVTTDGKSINAAEGELRFNPQDISVVSVNRNASVFNLWVTEPTFSNSAGTISFSGGSPTGYTGSGGTVFNITFRVLRAGTSRVTFSGGAVLANDGKGTNVLSGMSGGTYTLEATASTPAPELIEYVAPANTPAAPNVSSPTHKDAVWSNNNSAELSWTVPGDVTAMRTLLDSAPTSIPTKVYESPIPALALPDLPEGVSYFHIQFKNDEGWGRVTHYKLAVDTEKPESIEISLSEASDLTSPIQTLIIKTVDATSPVNRYMIRIDDGEAFEYIDETGKGEVTLPTLTPGYHSVLIEAFDAAQNGIIGSTSFTLLAFEQPIFTEYPTEINEEVIPVLRGTTRSNAIVEIEVQKIGADSSHYTTTADETGVFTFIPEGRFSQGVYEITARAVDAHGAQSLDSLPIRIAVQQPGYIQIGNRLVNFLSVVVSLVGLVALSVLLIMWLTFTMKRLRSRVGVESEEVITLLAEEFRSVENLLATERVKLAGTKKTKKLTQAEEALFAAVEDKVREMKRRLTKEVQDVEDVVHPSEKV